MKNKCMLSFVVHPQCTPVESMNLRKKNKVLTKQETPSHENVRKNALTNDAKRM